MLHDNLTTQDDDDISSGYYAELERRAKDNSPAMQYYNNYLEEQRQEKQQVEPIDESQQYVELHPSLMSAPAQEEFVIPDDPSLVKPQTELTQDNQEPSLIEKGWDKLPREAQMIAWPFMAPFVKGANEENPIARGVVGGTQNAAQGIVDLGRDITNALGGDFNEEDWLKIPRILESNPDSTTEAVVSGLSQFMSIFGMAGGISKGATLAKQVAGGAFADASFDPTGGNLATLLRQLDIDNSLTQFLDSKVGEDADALERLEARGLQILEGAGIGFAIPALIGAVRWSKNKGAPWIKEFLQDSDPNLIPKMAETFGIPNPTKGIVAKGVDARTQVDELGFYSQAEKVLNTLKQETNMPVDVKRYMLKKGVTIDEMKDTGLLDLLQAKTDKKSKITKQELLDHISTNKTKLSEFEYQGLSDAQYEDVIREGLDDPAVTGSTENNSNYIIHDNEHLLDEVSEFMDYSIRRNDVQDYEFEEINKYLNKQVDGHGSYLPPYTSQQKSNIRAAIENGTFDELPSVVRDDVEEAVTAMKNAQYMENPYYEWTVGIDDDVYTVTV